ncbi:hypothetical protein IGI04_001040 [Brassica rapa subsp. trilocularis]|uniref:TLC domain-containing protein n=1 Tax=Brassica rapa subsp. trilocularis TaxID=1813537 RepID=A0ABQ7NRR8_BRACM|nr:hypothetical protein IGI04_001040 [Brassica rapa subsp. trilocularis]
MDVMPYQNQAEGFVKRYLLADPCLPYTSVLAGIFLCKMVYDLMESFSSIHIKSYSALTKMKRIEWNNRRVGISTVHAIFISLMALYFVFFSDLFSDQTSLQGLMVFRSSPLSNFGLGVSVGYFLADLGMIIWLYPSLGGLEYIFHHSLSGVAVAYSLFSGEAQLYTYMVLISEVTTPSINLRWYLDTAGLKRSKAYLINGVAIFLAWLTARILLFIYMFYHVYIHYDQVANLYDLWTFLAGGTDEYIRLSTGIRSTDCVECNELDVVCFQVLLGDVGAGKSSLVLRFVKDQFVEFQESTIGAAFFSQTLAVNDATVKFEIWDTAGQERYHSLAPMYYRGAAAAIIVFDASFERAKKWVQELQAQGNTNMVMALAGNKSDLLDAKKVTAEEAQTYAQENGLFFMETSAKTAANVKEIFYEIARRLPRVQPTENPTGMVLPDRAMDRAVSSSCCA